MFRRTPKVGHGEGAIRSQFQVLAQDSSIFCKHGNLNALPPLADSAEVSRITASRLRNAFGVRAAITHHQHLV